MTDRRDLYPTTGCARVLPCPASSHARHGRRWTDPQGTAHSIPSISTQTPLLLYPFPSLLFSSPLLFLLFSSLLYSSFFRSLLFYFFSFLFFCTFSFFSFPLVRNMSRHDNAIKIKNLLLSKLLKIKYPLVTGVRRARQQRQHVEEHHYQWLPLHPYLPLC
jgi:hypothetical protein